MITSAIQDPSQYALSQAPGLISEKPALTQERTKLATFSNQEVFLKFTIDDTINIQNLFHEHFNACYVVIFGSWQITKEAYGQKSKLLKVELVSDFFLEYYACKPTPQLI